MLSNINDLPINFDDKEKNNFPTKKVHYYIGEYESWKEKESPSFTTSYCKDEYLDVILQID
jgi:hypothetical protein